MQAMTFWKRKVCAGLVLGMVCFSVSVTHAAIINESRVVSATSALAVLVPTAENFTVATAGNYTLTLTDVGETGAYADSFSALSLVVSQGAQLIKQAAVPSSASTVTVSVTLAAGQYQLQVLGVTSGASLYGVQLKDTQGATVWQTSGTIEVPASSNFNVLQENLNLVAGQSYIVSIADRNFPAALTSLQMSIVQPNEASSVICSRLTVAGTSASCTFTASQGVNQLVVLATEATGGAGLYSVNVADAAGASVFARSLPLGTLPQPVTLSLPATGTYTLSSVDFHSPATLATFKLALLQGADQLLAQTTAQTNTFDAESGHAELYVVASAASGSAGLYSVQVKQGSTSVYSKVTTVENAVSTGLDGYVFTAELPAAGNYTLQLRDFIFPQSFASLSASVSQGSAVLGTLTAAGTLAISNASAGELNIAVLAKPGSSAGGLGLLGISLAASGSSTPVLEVNQGVGGHFVSQKLLVTAATHYQLTATDFVAPLALEQFRIAVTRGATTVGSSFGGGSFGIDATPGEYQVNVLASAKTAGAFGVYGLSLVAPPVITLTSNTTTIDAGGSVTLTWSAVDATTCTASAGAAGSWTGSKAVIGTQQVGALSNDATLTLTCTGAAGTSVQSVAIKVNAPAVAGKGGGGASSLLLVMLMAGLQLYRRSSRSLCL